MNKKLVVFFLVFMAAALAGCQSVSTPAPVAVNTEERQSTATITPTPLSTETETPLPVSTITPTIGPTSIAGVGKVSLYCEVPESGGFFEFDLATNQYKQLTNSWTGSKQEDFKVNLTASGLSPRFVSELLKTNPIGLFDGCCTEIIAASKDGNSILLNKIGPTIFDPSFLYWVQEGGSSKKIILSEKDGYQVQEASINYQDDKVAMRVSLDNRFAILMFDLKNGTYIDLVPDSDNDNIPYGVEISPDGKYVTYTYRGGVWVSSSDGKDNKLIVKDASNSDWSFDSQELVFVFKGMLATSNFDGTDFKEIDTGSSFLKNISDPEWVMSPGQRKVVFWSKNTEWDLLDLDTLELSILKTDQQGSSFTLGYSHKWSPDGNWFLGGMMNSITQKFETYLCDINLKRCIPLDAGRPSDSYCRYERSNWVTSFHPE